MSQLVLGSMAKGHELLQQLLHRDTGSRTLSLSLYYILLVEDMRYKYLLNGYNLTKDGHHVLLPNNLSELNEYMCGPLNRKDYICSECKSGYGPAIISESASCSSWNMCFLCKDTRYNLLLYLLLQFISITVFCLLVLIFQSQADLCPNDMFHHVQSTDGDGILQRVCTSVNFTLLDKIY